MPFIGVQPFATAITATSLDGVTSSAAELNILDGVTSTAAELNILDGVTSTAAELNYLDITTLGGSEASKVVTADSSGNVGIGTSSPAQLLDVGDHTAAGNRSMRISQRTGTGAQTYGGIEFFFDNTAGTTGVNAAIKYAAGPLRNDGELTFHTGASASISERLRIDHNGNVGIGTASPTHDLTVGSTGAADYVIALRGGVGGFLGWDDSANTTILQAPNTRSLSFQVNSDTFSAGTEAMRISSSGNVGIGTTSTTFRFNVSSASSTTSNLASTSSTSNLRLTNSGGLATVGSTGNALHFTTSTTERMRINSTGVVQFENGLSEKYNAVTSSSNATTVDLLTGTNFSHTLTENTTFTFSNPTASGRVSAFTLKLVQDSSASGYTVTWPSSVDWPSATAPTLTATANAVDYFVFITHDGGTNYYGFTAGQALG